MHLTGSNRHPLEHDLGLVGAQGWLRPSAVVDPGVYASLRDLKLGEMSLGIDVVPEVAVHLTLGNV